MKRARWDQGYCRGPIESPIHAFDWFQNQVPWITLKGHYAFGFKTHGHAIVNYLYSFTFILLLGTE